jgi:uncharacterized protein YigA (DUF484 family)
LDTNGFERLPAQRQMGEFRRRPEMPLMEQATANQSLFQRLFHLQTRLASADSLDEMLNPVGYEWVRTPAGSTPDGWI